MGSNCKYFMWVGYDDRFAPNERGSIEIRSKNSARLMYFGSFISKRLLKLRYPNGYFRISVCMPFFACRCFLGGEPVPWGERFLQSLESSASCQFENAEQLLFLSNFSAGLILASTINLSFKSINSAWAIRRKKIIDSRR